VHADRIGKSDITNTNFAEWPTTQTVKKGTGWEFELGAVDVAQRISSYSDAVRILHGMADRMDRLASAGNGQVPAVAELAWRVLRRRIGLKKNTVESLQTAGNT
jgi:hypothetical protein